MNYCIITLNWDIIVVMLSIGCTAGQGMPSLIALFSHVLFYSEITQARTITVKNNYAYITGNVTGHGLQVKPEIHTLYYDCVVTD